MPLNIPTKKTCVQLLTSIGLGQDLSESLYDGGIIPFPIEFIESHSVQFSGKYFNEVSINAKLHNLANAIVAEPSDSILYDLFFGRGYAGLDLSKAAVYGKTGTQMIVDVPQSIALRIGSVRAAFKEIPVYYVAERRHLEQLLGIAEQSLVDGHKLMLRGQNKLYSLNRPNLAKEFLYGSNESFEPNLMTNAARNAFDYAAVEELIDLDLQAILYERMNLPQSAADWLHNTSASIKDEYLAYRVRQEGIEKGAWASFIMAVSQHYGIPTYGLDVTSNIDVALWFANNSFYKESGIGGYKKLIQTAGQSSGNLPIVGITTGPVMFVLSSLESHLIDLSEHDFNPYPISVRAQRQHGYFLCGGWGAHRNTCAEDLLCIIRLDHNLVPCREVTYQHLFPSRDDDPLYGMLLDRKKLHDHSTPFGAIYDYIVEYSNK